MFAISLLVCLSFGSYHNVLAQPQRVDKIGNQRSSSIRPAVAQSVRIYPSFVRVQKGKTKTITAAAYDASGNPVFDAVFDSFSTSNTEVASLSPVLVSGDDISTPTAPPPNLRTVTGKNAGVVYASASWNGAVSEPIQIIVDDPSANPSAIVHGDNDQSGGMTISTRVGEPIELSADSSRGVERIEWDWGDGDTTTGVLSATHAYLFAGSFPLSVTVTNRFGQSAASNIMVNVSDMSPPTRIIQVNSIAELLTAYNTAVGGEHIVIPAGTTLIGEIALPARNFSDYVTIRSSALMPSLLDRVSPAQAGLVTLQAPYGNGIPLRIQNGATKLRFAGLKFQPKYIPDVNGPSTYYLVQIGEAFTQTSTTTNPSKIIFEHCVINPPDDVNVVHGILNDGYKVSILASWLGNIKTFGGQDSQAVVSFDGKGAHVYNNTFFEAASENIMYGGAVPSIDGLTSTNIEVRRCFFSKRMTWRQYSGESHQVNVKNLFETKNARRLYVEGSVLENHWDALRSQLFALVFKSAASSGVPGEFVPWAISEDIVFENNRLKGMFGGVTTATDSYWLGNFRAMKPNNIVIKNTLFDDLSNRWGAPGNSNGGRLIQPNNAEDMLLDHVTMIDKDRSAGTAVALVTNNNLRLRITNSIFGLGGYGIIGSGVGPGIRSLNLGTGGVSNVCDPDAAASWSISNNVMPFYGGSVSCYPHQESFQNAFPYDYQSVGFTDLNGGDYGLSPSSPFRGKAADGYDPGVDWQTLSVRTACTVGGETAPCLGIANAAHEVTGRVVDGLGYAIRGALVTLINEGGNTRTASSNTFGNFSFSDLPSGSYVISARGKHGEVSRTLSITGDVHQFELQLPAK